MEREESGRGGLGVLWSSWSRQLSSCHLSVSPSSHFAMMTSTCMPTRTLPSFLGAASALSGRGLGSNFTFRSPIPLGPAWQRCPAGQTVCRSLPGHSMLLGFTGPTCWGTPSQPHSLLSCCGGLALVDLGWTGRPCCAPHCRKADAHLLGAVLHFRGRVAADLGTGTIQLPSREHSGRPLRLPCAARTGLGFVAGRGPRTEVPRRFGRRM